MRVKEGCNTQGCKEDKQPRMYSNDRFEGREGWFSFFLDRKQLRVLRACEFIQNTRQN